MCLDDRSRDRQAEASAAPVAGAASIDPVKPLEDMGKLFGRDSRAVIGDRELDPTVDRPGRDRHRVAWRCVLHGIPDQVAEYLGHSVGVDFERALPGADDAEVAVAKERRVALDVGEQVGQLDLAALDQPSVLGPGKREHLVHQPGHPLDLPREGIQDLPLRIGVVPQSLQQVDLAAEHRQRGAELMRRVGDERALALEGALEPIEHAIE